MGLEPDAELRIRAACDAEDWDRALTLALETYGSELMSYLVAILRNVTDADDVFGEATSGLWRGLRTFRWESSLRTFVYVIARHAFLAHARKKSTDQRLVDLSSPAVQAVVANVRSRTATYLRTEVKDKIATLRAALDPEDQALLILRVNRQLPWRDIARIMSDDGDDDLTRRAASLRKRFERLKEDLRAKATALE